MVIDNLTPKGHVEQQGDLSSTLAALKSKFLTQAEGSVLISDFATAEVSESRLTRNPTGGRDSSARWAER